MSRVFSIASLLLISAFAGFAQPGGGGPPGGGGAPCANPPCNPVPITGIELLIGMGAALGVRTVINKKRGK